MGNLKPVIDDIRKMIEAGYNAERSDPTQIAHAIDLLGQNLRAYEIGASRLVTSGEYAMPQLVQKLTDRSTSATLTERIISVLPRMGKDAVRPLSAALAAKDQGLLQIAAEALGRIRYADATAALKEMLERKDLVDRTRQVATAALVACGGQAATSTPVASLLYDQAEKYYYNRQSVPLDPNSPAANVWSWREGLGLEYQAVPKAIFGDIYAMRLAQAALKYDPSFYPAVSLWLAAKMQAGDHSRRSAGDSRAGAVSPARSSTPWPAAPSTSRTCSVGPCGTTTRRWPCGRLRPWPRPPGPRAWSQPVAGGVQPLVEALSNRDRQVRLMAALALANALPQGALQGRRPRGGRAQRGPPPARPAQGPADRRRRGPEEPAQGRAANGWL